MTMPAGSSGTPFQGDQVGHYVGKLSGSELVLVRRHPGFLLDGVFAQAGLRNGPEALMAIDDLHRVGVFVQTAAGNRLSVAGHRSNEPVFWLCGGFRIGQGILQESRISKPALFAKVGSDV